jgi:hypothetical protein
MHRYTAPQHLILNIAVIFTTFTVITMLSHSSSLLPLFFCLSFSLYLLLFISFFGYFSSSYSFLISDVIYLFIFLLFLYMSPFNFVFLYFLCLPFLFLSVLSRFPSIFFSFLSLSQSSILSLCLYLFSPSLARYCPSLPLEGAAIQVSRRPLSVSSHADHKRHTGCSMLRCDYLMRCVPRI